VQSQGQTARITPADGTQDKIIKLYPNPAQSYITFDLQKNYKPGLTIHVYNGILGKRMYENQNISEKFTLNLTDFTRGVYIYHLVDANGKIIESGKFQVSR
jgi:hypothetical protein